MTLLETLVAMAILSLISVLGYPEMARMQDYLLLRRTSFLVVSDLRLTRAGAIGTGSVTTFAISRDGRSYRWSGGPARAMPDSLRLSSRETMRFFPDGTASGGELVVSGRRNRIGIAVDSAIGDIAMTGLR